MNINDAFKTVDTSEQNSIDSKILEKVKTIQNSMDLYMQTQSSIKKHKLIKKINDQIQETYGTIADHFFELKTVNKAEAFGMAIKDFILLSKLLVEKGNIFLENADFINDKIIKLYESYLDYILLLLHLEPEGKLIRFNNIVLLVLYDLKELGLFFAGLGTDYIKELYPVKKLAENFIKEAADKMAAAGIEKKEQVRIKNKFKINFSYMIEEWYKTAKASEAGRKEWIKCMV